MDKRWGFSSAYSPCIIYVSTAVGKSLLSPPICVLTYCSYGLVDSRFILWVGILHCRLNFDAPVGLYLDCGSPLKLSFLTLALNDTKRYTWQRLFCPRCIPCRPPCHACAHSARACAHIHTHILGSYIVLWFILPMFPFAKIRRCMHIYLFPLSYTNGNRLYSFSLYDVSWKLTPYRPIGIFHLLFICSLLHSTPSCGCGIVYLFSILHLDS